MFELFNNFTEILFSISGILIPFLIIKYIWDEFQLRKQLPPGPLGLPFVGYLPFLGKKPQKVITKLGEKYGNVLTLQLGAYNVVILNDLQSIKDAFNNDMFSGRPEETPFSLVLNNKGLVDDSGHVWQEHRKFTITSLSHLGFGKRPMEESIIDEIQVLLKMIDKSRGQSFNIHSLLIPSISNNICKLVFGHRFEFEDPKRRLLDKSIEETSQRFSYLGLLSLSPIWLAKLFIKIEYLFKDYIIDENSQTVFNLPKIFEDEITIHKDKFDGTNTRDYIDYYLKEIKIKSSIDPDTSYTMDKVFTNSWGLFSAGSEPPLSAIEWALIFAVKYSEHQKKIQKEIDSVIGRERSPVWADRLQMPFTQAFIYETLRYRPIGPLGLMRGSVENSSILGHSIPKGTRILANIWAVHYDPKLWSNPKDFNPNRFLTEVNKRVINTENMMAFSTGKRLCGGEVMAWTEIFLYLTSILQRYSISAANGIQLLTDYTFGLTLKPKDTLILRFNKRF